MSSSHWLIKRAKTDCSCFMPPQSAVRSMPLPISNKGIQWTLDEIVTDCNGLGHKFYSQHKLYKQLPQNSPPSLALVAVPKSRVFGRSSRASSNYSSCESKCQSRGDRKMGPFQNMKGIVCKGCLHKALSFQGSVRTLEA